MGRNIYRALGLMSGTTLDGVDGSICVTDGHGIIGIEGEEYRPYSDQEHAILRKALGKWPEDRDLADAHEVILQAHQEVIERFKQPDLIGFHGQTLAHDPQAGRTHQLGDGAMLAKRVNAPVVWDFRRPDMEQGGQGAPLAPFYHFAMARQLGQRTPLAFVNLGGVGNITFVDPSKPSPEATGALIAFDTGPANALINDLVYARTGAQYDKGGKFALAGQIDHAVLSAAFEHPYFEAPAPKSLDRDDFAAIQQACSALDIADAAATLTAFSASCVYAAQMHLPRDPARWIITGGGRHNPAMMNALAQRLDQPVAAIDTIGFNGDMVEAQAFGYLAARVVEGLPTSAPMTTGCRSPVCGGTISDPN